MQLLHLREKYLFSPSNKQQPQYKLHSNGLDLICFILLIIIIIIIKTLNKDEIQNELQVVDGQMESKN